MKNDNFSRRWRKWPCCKRVAIKRMLRRYGVTISNRISGDLHALRALRQQIMDSRASYYATAAKRAAAEN